jgi:hypothetical protein
VGHFRTIRDDAPPIITNINFTDNAKNPTKQTCYILFNLGHWQWHMSKAEIYCDKKWLLAEYDGPRGTLSWEQDEGFTVR